MLSKSGIIGSKKFKKYYLASYFKNAVIAKKNREILDINEEIKQLKISSRDPFITAAEITKLKNYEDIVGNNYRLLLNEVDIIISKLEKNFVWNFYKYLYIFLDTVMHGSKIAIYKRNIHIDDLFLDDLFLFESQVNYMFVHNNIRRLLEKRLLSALLMNQISEKEIDLIKKKHFEGRDHQAIFKAIQTSHKENQSITVSSVSSILERQNNLMRIGGFDYIVECAEFNGIFKINFNRLFSTLASFNQTEIIKDKINDLLYEIFDKPFKNNEVFTLEDIYKYSYKINNLIDSNIDNLFQIPHL
jgi:hypothetical protein